MDCIFKIGGQSTFGSITENGSYLRLKFRFCRPLIDEIKISLEGARWEPDSKTWKCPITERNLFVLDYLTGKKPYERFKVDPETVKLNLDFLKIEPYQHQLDIAKFILARKQCIIAGEMGVGKTLSTIIAINTIGTDDIIWVGPKSALISVKMEFHKWGGLYPKTFVTYDSLKKIQQSPKILVLDECQKLKNYNTQRVKATIELIKYMKIAHPEIYIIMLSGTPAPRSPADWWSLAEIIQPGYLREGHIKKFTQRLAIIVQENSALTGGFFPKLLAWKDNPDRCLDCGKFQSDQLHNTELAIPVPANEKYKNYHIYNRCGKNEVEDLYKRMSSIVLVKLKKNCLSLPDKVYRVIELKPSQELLVMAKMLANVTSSSLKLSLLLRQLSDGFQYNSDEVAEDPEMGDFRFIGSDKLGAIIDLLEEFDERVVIYAAFTTSVELVAKHVENEGWNVIKIKSSRWYWNGHPINPEEALNRFNNKADYEKVAFVANPESAGVGLNLTASPVAIYYSNGTKGEARTQSKDRIHRPGMCGANIIDLVLLPTDKLMLRSLEAKRDLELLTLGEITQCLETAV